MTVEITISGAAHRVIQDGNWQRDCPRGWEALKAGTWRKAGYGQRVKASMERTDAVDLWFYLESVAEVLENMSATERGPDGTSEARAARRAMKAITDVIGDPRGVGALEKRFVEPEER